MKLSAGLFGLLSVTIAAAGALTIIYATPTKHDVIVLNRTSKDIKVMQVRIDNNTFDAGGALLPPTKLKERRNDPGKHLSYSYKSTGGSSLTVFAVDTTNTHMQLTCKLIDKNRAGCIFYVGIRDAATLTCVCDSKADFYD